MSGRLTAVMHEPYLRFCLPCDATHLYEQPFRLAALRAGLELQPGTSPPVLRPIPGFTPADRRPGAARRRPRVPAPARAGHPEARRRLPRRPGEGREGALARGRRRGGRRRRAALAPGRRRRPAGRRAAAATRLLGPFDLFLQARDRPLLVPDRAHAKELWPVLGRPGGVLVDGEIVGTWRARKAGAALTVSVELWAPADREPSPSRPSGSPPSAGCRSKASRSATESLSPGRTGRVRHFG